MLNWGLFFNKTEYFLPQFISAIFSCNCEIKTTELFSYRVVIYRTNSTKISTVELKAGSGMKHSSTCLASRIGSGGNMAG